MFDRFASIFALYASALDVMFDRFARVFCKVACSSAFVAFSSTIFALSAAIVTLFFSRSSFFSAIVSDESESFFFNASIAAAISGCLLEIIPTIALVFASVSLTSARDVWLSFAPTFLMSVVKFAILSIVGWFCIAAASAAAASAAAFAAASCSSFVSVIVPLMWYFEQSFFTTGSTPHELAISGVSYALSVPTSSMTR